MLLTQTQIYELQGHLEGDILKKDLVCELKKFLCLFQLGAIQKIHDTIGE